MTHPKRKRYDLSHNETGTGLMRLLTFNELRTVLGGRGRTTIYRDVAAGRLPEPLKFGGRIYWREEDIAEVLQKSKDNGHEE